MEWFFDKPQLYSREVKTFEDKWVCPECKMGYMIYTNSMWPTGDPGYHHKCDGCGHTAAIQGGSFPKLRFETVE